MAQRLVDRELPPVSASGLLARLVPPPQFADVSFASYRPDPAHPSQAGAVASLREYAAALPAAAVSPARRGILRRRVEAASARGVYLDGGFGVGKTHLLASLWHVSPAPKSYCTFVEMTHLVGALGFRTTVDSLAGHRLLCIDEFELDDPGDTVLVSTLLTALHDSGVALAVTSNTLPDALGEGRFAASDFLREIQGLAARFDVLTVDGEDYRHRGLPAPPEPATEAELGELEQRSDAAVDDFADLLARLGALHPSRYGDLLDGVSALGWREVRTVADQAAALRLVVLVDRAYDRGLPLLATGERLDRLFTAEILAGGYRKKYLRAVSRACALCRLAPAR